MSAAEQGKRFAQALIAGNHQEAGEAMQILMAEPNGPTQVAQMMGVLLTGMQKGSIRRALEWVLQLPGASTVLVDVRAGLARVEAGGDLEQTN
jgi:hypothetical protein